MKKVSKDQQETLIGHLTSLLSQVSPGEIDDVLREVKNQLNLKSQSSKPCSEEQKPAESKPVSTACDSRPRGWQSPYNHGRLADMNSTDRVLFAMKYLG